MLFLRYHNTYRNHFFLFLVYFLPYYYELFESYYTYYYGHCVEAGYGEFEGIITCIV